MTETRRCGNRKGAGSGERYHSRRAISYLALPIVRVATVTLCCLPSTGQEKQLGKSRWRGLRSWFPITTEGNRAGYHGRAEGALPTMSQCGLAIAQISLRRTTILARSPPQLGRFSRLQDQQMRHVESISYGFAVPRQDWTGAAPTRLVSGPVV